MTPPEPTASPAVTDQQQVVAVSGYRPSLFKSLSSPTVANFPVGVIAAGETTPNPAWTDGPGRHKILRPRPIDHVYNTTSEFPYPPANADGTVTGDVQNYKFANGAQRNDSLWMYPGQPVTDYKGKKITALVAPMLLPLDGRVNLNAAGNQLAAGQHGSHSGFGPHEIALWRVLQNATTMATQAQLAANQIVAQRYNGRVVPNPAELPDALTANTLATASPQGTRYPAYPTTNAPPFPASPFGVQTFHPAAVPFSINGSGTNSTLQANQIVPPVGSQVNFGAAAFTYSLPGGAPPTDPNARYFGVTPDYTQWATAGSNSAFVAANPNPPTPGSAQGDTVQHPLLWNPLRRGAFERGTSPSAVGVYPVSDLRYTAARYSLQASDIQNQTFLCDPSRAFNAGTPQFSQSGPNSTNDVNRALTTPISNSQQAAALPANFFASAGRTLQLTPSSVPGALPALPTLGTTPRPVFSVTAGGTDQGSDTYDGIGSNQQLVNRLARLGPLDLNRPLTDYPVDQTSPPGTPTFGKLTAAAMSANLPQVQAADNDRQRFATDIFIRLAVATGGRVIYDAANQRFAVDPALPATQPEYAALRWLAQYAANIVDAIDGDDVSFAFVWNPADPANPRDAANFQTAERNNRVVFGVEKPRLVLNEVYGELANDEQDTTPSPTMRPFQARFFLELLNPGVSDANAITAPNVSLTNGTQGVYKIEVTDQSTLTRSELIGAAAVNNVTGAISSSRKISTTTAGLQVAAPMVTDINGNTLTATDIEPNNGFFNFAGTARRGFAFVGPGSASGATTKLKDAMPAKAFAPDVADAATGFNLMLQKPLTPSGMPTNPGVPEPQNLAYFIGAAKEADFTDNMKPVYMALNQRHAVVLRRLANPYLPLNDPSDTGYTAGNPENPWITVDAVYDVKLFDSVNMVQSPTTGPSVMRMMPPTADSHGSIGRAQPYAGYMTASAASYPMTPAAAPDPYFVTGTPTRRTVYGTTPANLTLRQKITEVENANAPGAIHHTFMQHNADNPGGLFSTQPVPSQVNPNQSDLNLQYPFGWLTHFGPAADQPGRVAQRGGR